MRRKDKELKNLMEIEGVIHQAQVLRIAMFDQQYPYLVPVCFGYDDGIFYFHSAPFGKKVTLLKADPRVCFELEGLAEALPGDAPCNWTMRYASVIGYGEVFPLSEPEEQQRALRIIFRQYGGSSAEIPESSGNLAVFKIVVASLTGKASPPRITPEP
jgi:uncharacterized protein